MDKNFFEVFPNLKVNKELEELLELVTVFKVSCNPSKTHIWVYIKCERWIHKKNIFDLEEQIERQCFSGLQMQITVIEKFRLSGQYTPENFLDTYRSSMELELRNYNMLEYNLFKQAKISFAEENKMLLVLPDSVIAREKSDILVEYLHKVFCERCGMDLNVSVEFEEVKESRFRKNAALQIQQEVENVIRHAGLNSNKEKKPEPEVKERKSREYPEKKQILNPDLIYGRDFEGEPVSLESITGEMGEVIIRGQVLDVEERQIRNEKTILIFPVTDFTDSIVVKMFLKNEQVPDVPDM